MDKAGELEARWRGHVGAWRASGGSQKAYGEQHGLRSHSLSYWHLRLAKGPGSSGARGPLTLVPAVRVPNTVASTPSLSLHSPQGGRLDFAALPPAGWLTALWGERA
jgi:hypothetical protein